MMTARKLKAAESVLSKALTELREIKAERDQAISLLKEWNLAGYFPSHDEWKAWETEFGGRVREFLSARA